MLNLDALRDARKEEVADAVRMALANDIRAAGASARTDGEAEERAYQAAAAATEARAIARIDAMMGK